VRYTGKPDPAPKGLRVTDKGIHLDFHQPLDPETAGDPDNYGIEQYNYRWTSNYGSKEYRVSNPSELGRDSLDILGVALSADKKSVFLRVDGLGPVMQSEITMRIKTASGAAVPEKLWHTINAVGREPGTLPELRLSEASRNAIPTAGSGVALTLKAGAKTDVRRDRIVALHVPAGESASPFIGEGPFQAQWDAVLPMGSKRDVVLLAEGTGSVRVFVGNGRKEPLFEGELSQAGKRLSGKLPLNKGSNALRVEYTSPRSGDATLRLLWSSSDFREEPVPPSALLLPAAFAEAVSLGTKLRSGRQLFAQANCVSCHDSQGVLSPKGSAKHSMPEMMRQAPLLTDVGARFNEGWLVRWIQDPHQFRSGSLMPAVLNGPEARRDAEDLAAFLVGKAGGDSGNAVKGDVGAGGALFGNLGCIACHSTPQSKAGNHFDRVSLAHMSSKWKPGALRDYLQDPHRYHPGSRMPKTPLSEEEAGHLVTFLMSFPADEYGSGTKGDAARGAQLLATVGCIQCHAGAPGGGAPSLAKILDKDWTNGCVADSREKAGKAPDYRFSAEQRSALRLFAKAGISCVEKDSSLEYAQRAVADLRCSACHAMDARQSLWSAVSEEANMIGALKSSGAKNSTAPRATTSIPTLTWLGEKLQPDWSARMIAGKVETKTRPYLLGRMPGFAGDAEALARGLSHWHGFSHKDNALASAPGGDAAAIAAGQVLVGDQGGFACTVCHDVGNRPATAPFEAPAVNLAWAGQRLRLSYFERWLLQPNRLDAETKMPRYADIHGKTQLKQHFEGNGIRQFDAIRQYLISLKEP
jgi:cytochrome c2